MKGKSTLNAASLVFFPHSLLSSLSLAKTTGTLNSLVDRQEPKYRNYLGVPFPVIRRIVCRIVRFPIAGK